MKTILVDAVNTLFINQDNKFIIDKRLFDILEDFSNPKIVLTNADDDQMKIFGLNNSPYPVFSLKHKPDKTNPEYYKAFLSEYKLNKSEVVYFEHNLDAVKSAESEGINTFHYNFKNGPYGDLKNFLNSNL
jgi:FMN phosphatase YigB (HAD superfamily)